jgi:hypothetical protein
VHGDAAAYEVEFVTLGGETLTVVTLPADAICAIARADIS